MKKYRLGEFEEIVMLTVGILGDKAYGVSIKKEIEARAHRSVSVGALQVALSRLEDKGYLKSRVGEKTQVRVGRPKKYYETTAHGKAALEYCRNLRNELWIAMNQIRLDPNTSNQ